MGCFFFNTCQRQCNPYQQTPLGLCPPEPCPPGPYPPRPYPPKPYPPRPKPDSYQYPSAIATLDTTDQTLTTTFINLRHGETIYSSGVEFKNLASSILTITKPGVYRAYYTINAEVTFDAVGTNEIEIRALLGETLPAIPGSETVTLFTSEQAGTETAVIAKEFTFSVSRTQTPITFYLQGGVLGTQNSTEAKLNTVSLHIVRIG